MFLRLKPWQLGLLLVTLCATVLGGVFYLRFARPITPAEMLTRLPAANAVLVYLDFRALGAAGILDSVSGSKIAQDPDYRTFVSISGFDYQRDLDTAFASFRDGHAFILASGRFDWGSFRSYVTLQKGTCLNGFCRMLASQPDRFLSFQPLQKNYVAFASSPDPYAVSNMAKTHASETRDLPDHPVWVSVPGSVFRSSMSLPAGAKLFAAALGDTETSNFGLERAGQGYVLSLAARTKSLVQANIVTLELKKITSTMAEYFTRIGKTPNRADLSGVLTEGKFEQQGPNVTGRWQISQAFIDALVTGQL